MAVHDLARQIVIDAPGDAEVMALRAIALPRPTTGEMVLRQEAIGLNYHEVCVRSGAYRTMQYPVAPGIEAAGTTKEVGPGVTGFCTGQRGAYICGTTPKRA